MTRAESIPRYEQPIHPLERIVTGRCISCDHRVNVNLDGKVYMLCVQERDDRREGQLGEVYECDPQVTDCEDWDAEDAQQ